MYLTDFSCTHIFLSKNKSKEFIIGINMLKRIYPIHTKMKQDSLLYAYCPVYIERKNQEPRQKIQYINVLQINISD